MCVCIHPVCYEAPLKKKKKAGAIRYRHKSQNFFNEVHVFNLSVTKCVSINTPSLRYQWASTRLSKRNHIMKTKERSKQVGDKVPERYKSGLSDKKMAPRAPSNL